MSVNCQFYNQSEASFNIIGSSELAMEIEEDNIGVIGNSELAMIEPALYWTGGGPPAWSLNKKKNAGGG